MKLGVTGASGLVGSCLVREASGLGWEVVPFSRRARAGVRLFQPGVPADCPGLDAVVHLAGEPVLGVWTPAKKRRIMESRVQGTRSIVEGLRAAEPRPRVMVCASAVGFYGSTSRSADEDSPPGEGYLAEVCRAWEEEAVKAEDLGVRVVRLRIGFVMGPSGAFRFIVPVFRAGLGGRIGSGQQWMSGIHVGDVAGMALWAVTREDIQGPLNAVMPEPFRNIDFTRELADLVHRPALFPVPAFALRLALGDLARILLDDVRVIPAKAVGYTFRFPTLRGALADLLAPSKG